MQRNGRFATVTNFRDAVPSSGKFRSRGHLITEFLASDAAPAAYLEGINGEDYAGFNLLVSDGTELAYLSNRGGGLQVLPAGIYGVANATLDAAWEKVERSKAALLGLIDAGQVNASNLLRLLGDRNKASVREVETGQLSFAQAHAMTAPFIVQPDYGTRCSTIVLRDNHNKLDFSEVRFDPCGARQGRSTFSFKVDT